MIQYTFLLAFMLLMIMPLIITLSTALKDETAGSSVDVTLAGDIGGDAETVTVDLITAGGYYEGSIPFSWTGVDGPVMIGARRPGR